MKAREMMTMSPVTTSPEEHLLSAAETMLFAQVSALPVISADQLVGIITEGDLLRRWEAGTERKYQGFAAVRAGIDQMAADFVRSHGGYVRDLMTKNVVAIDEEAPLENAIRLFEKHGFNQLPVTGGGTKLTGVITRRNILEAFVANAKQMRMTGEHTDDDIKRALFAIYTRELWAPLDRIDLYVKNGIVEIVGNVERESQRRAIIAAAEGIPGVKKVVDHMNEANTAKPDPTDTIRSFVDGQNDQDPEG